MCQSSGREIHDGSKPKSTQRAKGIQMQIGVCLNGEETRVPKGSSVLGSHCPCRPPRKTPQHLPAMFGRETSRAVCR